MSSETVVLEAELLYGFTNRWPIDAKYYIGNGLRPSLDYEGGMNNYINNSVYHLSPVTCKFLSTGMSIDMAQVQFGDEYAVAIDQDNRLHFLLCVYPSIDASVCDSKESFTVPAGTKLVKSGKIADDLVFVLTSSSTVKASVYVYNGLESAKLELDEKLTITDVSGFMAPSFENDGRTVPTLAFITKTGDD